MINLMSMTVIKTCYYHFSPESEAGAPYSFALAERPDAYCEPDGQRGFSWPQTLENTTAFAPCEKDSNGKGSSLFHQLKS